MTIVYLHEKSNFWVVVKHIFCATNILQYVSVLRVLLPSDCFICLLATLSTSTDCFRVRRQLELGGRQILTAAAAVMNVLAKCRRILRHLWISTAHYLVTMFPARPMTLMRLHFSTDIKISLYKNLHKKLFYTQWFRHFLSKRATNITRDGDWHMNQLWLLKNQDKLAEGQGQ